MSDAIWTGRTILTAAALHAAAPYADPDRWLPPLQSAFDKWGVSTPRRQAAALGQFAVEAGSNFGELVECMNYTHAERLVAVWPTRFHTVADATPYVRNPENLANFVYANRLGNGDTESGDGWKFRGRGLIQITGRDEYTEVAASMPGMLPEDAADWCETPDGAAMSACWYLSTRNCLSLADNWQLTAITKRVNGAAMLGWKQRLASSNAALKVLMA